MYKALDKLVDERCRVKNKVGTKKQLVEVVKGIRRLDNRAAFGLHPETEPFERQYTQLAEGFKTIIPSASRAVPRKVARTDMTEMGTQMETEVADVETQAQPEMRSMRTQARGLEPIITMDEEGIVIREEVSVQQERDEYSLQRANREFELGAPTEKELEKFSRRVQRTPGQERTAREMERIRRELDFSYENLGLAEEKKIEDNIKSLSRRSKGEIVSKYKSLYNQLPEDQKASFVPPASMEVRVAGGFDKPRALGEIKRALQLLGYVDEEFDLVKDYIEEPERALETAGEVEAVLEEIVDELEVDEMVDEMLDEF